MQEAAQQPISFKRNYSIADWSIWPVGELISKVTGISGTNAVEAPIETCKPRLPRPNFAIGRRSGVLFVVQLTSGRPILASSCLKAGSP